jgi:hypothetical protein
LLRSEKFFALQRNEIFMRQDKKQILRLGMDEAKKRRIAAAFSLAS